MEDRIASSFKRAHSQNRASFVAYVCAGDPDFDSSLEVCRTLLRGGVDILELGVPFSDPLADGLANQLAAQRALESGMNQHKVLELVKALRAEFPEPPIVLYTYYNLVYSQGEQTYAERARAAGVDGLLTLDLPPEEATGLVAACNSIGIQNIFLASPTTPPERMARIAGVASGFIYYVSREGVTGVRDTLSDNIAEAVQAIKGHTQLPVVVGFGISKGEQVREVGSVAEGVVVGSALVNCIAETRSNRSEMLLKLQDKLNELLGGLKAVGA